MSRRSLRVRLTVFVGGVFLLTLLTTGAGMRLLLERNLRDDAIANAGSLLDEHLRLGASGVVPTRLDTDDTPRLRYLSADAEPLEWGEVDQLLMDALEAEFAELGPLIGPDGEPVEFSAVSENSAFVVSAFGDPAAPPNTDLAGPDAAAIDLLNALPPELAEPISIGVVAEDTGREVVEADGTLRVSQPIRIGETAASVTVSVPTAPIDAAVDNYTRVGLAAIPFLVFVVAAATWATASRALRPVEHIRRQVERTDPDALDHHVPVTGAGDEIDRLAGTMNDLLDRLHDAAEQRRRFISDASHELRSPITATLATLETTHADDPEWEHHREVLVREQHQLAALVDDLLTLATLDERRHEPASGQAVDLDEIAIQAAARPRRVPVRVTVDHPHRVIGRNDLLRRAVVNLVDNAARHADTVVEVTVGSTADGRPRLLVDDDGAGVAPAARRDIFDRFTRTDEARNRRDGGAGLGLAIVRDVAERHGATVTVDDAPIGGARFELRFGGSDQPSSASSSTTSAAPSNSKAIRRFCA